MQEFNYIKKKEDGDENLEQIVAMPEKPKKKNKLRNWLIGGFVGLGLSISVVTGYLVKEISPYTSAVKDFNKNEINILYITAPWCGICNEVKPDLENLAKEENVNLKEVNWDENKDLMDFFKKYYDVKGVPLTAVLNGRKIYSLVKGAKKETYKDKLKKIIEQGKKELNYNKKK